ncbi:endonuclease/exonuclease/phosphatase family protein [Luteolibacter pohnpeiensis]|uniref:Endonuclease/exonuclease/phosphatase family protein n=1 Tax=Luteolibacter pohnpeiensis TaxID=454153 RepID=A0A934SAX5_9BACT|nr:endonuclease/exonuclease/phosphatase family protein [Luteolibacter pohnpeiensis]MBK1882549.1 endonuclease/exonuclease/phosphatase family protein [Luteolibacter pohnpeiensis]
MNPTRPSIFKSFTPARRFGIRLMSGLALSLCASAMIARAATLEPSEPEFQIGETITLHFSGGPGNATDWIGLYPTGITPSGNPPSLIWKYTSDSQNAGGSLTSGSVHFTEPGLAAGTYQAWFLANDGYSALAGPVPVVVAADVNFIPVWQVEKIELLHAVGGSPYTGKISAYATTGGLRKFSKTAGPDWLAVAENGELSGTPGEADHGLQTFTFQVAGAQPDAVAEISATIQIDHPGEQLVPRFKVMSFNNWYQWTRMDDGFNKAIRGIVKSGADIIGLQESTNAVAQQAADELGWHRASSGSGSAQIISRYPIVETYTAGMAVGARIRLATDPVRDVILFNCHLDSSHYGPYAAEIDGATVSSVLAEENKSQRATQIAAILQAMTAKLSAADEIPVFLTGDFNAPSHLDWTAENAAAHDHVGAIPWPVSSQIAAAGMIDSFRLKHADPVSEPGTTWSTLQKGEEPQDRIDFVYHKGAGLKLIDSQVFHTEVEVTIGRYGSDISPIRGNSWPSDHAAVLSTYALGAADADSNGMADGWEKRWFAQLGNSPEADANHDGISNRDSMLLGISPTGEPQPAIEPPASPGATFNFSISDFALGYGLMIEHSADMRQWLPFWAFDEDPSFTDSKIDSATPQGFGDWKIAIRDPLPAAAARFYRVTIPQ